MYNLIVRPLLFLIDPEKVHRMLLNWLKIYRYLLPVRACVRGHYQVDEPFSYGSLRFKNRIGLSAGFDKNAETFDELADFGFGFLEVGTVTPDYQPGNPSPRIFRLVEDESLISRTGFNNCGVDVALEHIRKYRKHSYRLGVNINKNPLSAGEQIIKDFELVAGNPAVHFGWVGRYGEKLQFDSDGWAECKKTGYRYFLSDGEVKEYISSKEKSVK